MQRIVVVGASLGGLRVAEAVRAARFTGEVVVLGQESHLPYTRPPLSKEALAGGVSHAALEFRRRKSVDDVEWRLGVAVTGLNLAARAVMLPDGTALEFDGLAIATGLRPRRLALPSPPEGRYALRTIEDAVALRAQLVPDARVVIIGAGFIGCEVAATAVTMGCRVDVVAPEQVPLERPLGLLVGEAMRSRHERHGVRFHLGQVPAVLRAGAGDGDGSRTSEVVLDDGTELAADVVLEALGGLPNVEWVAGPDGGSNAGSNALDLADGVLTDGWLRALTREGLARSDVVAVGDIARYPNALFDDVPRRVEHWSNPTDTGRRAGPALVAGLTGQPLDPAPFAPVPSFWSDEYGERLQSFGLPGLADDVRLLQGDPEGEFVVGYLRSGLLVGVAGVGMMPELLRLRGEIAAAALSPDALG